MDRPARLARARARSSAGSVERSPPRRPGGGSSGSATARRSRAAATVSTGTTSTGSAPTGRCWCATSPCTRARRRRGAGRRRVRPADAALAGWRLERDLRGEPNGRAWERAHGVLEHAAKRAELDAIGTGWGERARDRVRELLAHGVVAIGDAGVTPHELTLLVAADLPIPVIAMPVGHGGLFATPRDALEGPKSGERMGAVTVGPLKLFADGAERGRIRIPYPLATRAVRSLGRTEDSAADGPTRSTRCGSCAPGSRRDTSARGPRTTPPTSSAAGPGRRGPGLRGGHPRHRQRGTALRDGRARGGRRRAPPDRARDVRRASRGQRMAGPA